MRKLAVTETQVDGTPSDAAIAFEIADVTAAVIVWDVPDARRKDPVMTLAFWV